jgi:hypothetical protein
MKKILPITILFVLYTSLCQGQYAFSTFSQDYAPLVDPTPVDLMGDDLWDDPEFVVDLGFEFLLNEAPVTSLIQLDLGAGLGNIGNDAGNLIGYFSDIINGANTNGAEPSTISFETVGAPGELIFKLQYENAAFFSEVEFENSAENRTNFQIWLHQIDNAIELHFGNSVITNPGLAYDFTQGPQIGIFIGLPLDDSMPEYAFGLNGPPNDPTFDPVDFDSFDFGLSGTPESGRVYRFSPTDLVSTQNLNDSHFSVFPTITQNVLNVRGVQGNPNYRIFDITGKEVVANRLNESAVIPVRDLQNGIYILSVEGKANSVRFIKK